MRILDVEERREEGDGRRGVVRTTVSRGTMDGAVFITLENVGLFNFNGKFVDVLLKEEGGADLRIELGSPSTTCELICKALVNSITVT